jgi:hypothetical protein
MKSIGGADLYPALSAARAEPVRNVTENHACFAIEVLFSVAHEQVD